MHTMKSPDTGHVSVYQWRRHVRDHGYLAAMSDAALRVYVLVELWAKEGTGTFGLSPDQATEQAGKSRATMTRGLRELQDQGLIEKTRRGGRGRVTQWRICTPPSPTNPEPTPTKEAHP